jgi:hypothetical protein
VSPTLNFFSVDLEAKQFSPRATLAPTKINGQVDLRSNAKYASEATLSPIKTAKTKIKTALADAKQASKLTNITDTHPKSR